VISPWETRFQPREHRRRHTTKHAGRGYPTGSASETLGNMCSNMVAGVEQNGKQCDSSARSRRL
jgi:hypothetical protein